MRVHLAKLVLDESSERVQSALEFCRAFEQSDCRKRYVLGRNDFSASIAQCYPIDGFIDEFTDELEYLGRPVIKLGSVEPDALVVSSVIGRPLTIDMKLAIQGCRYLDYFFFRKYIGRKPAPARFEDGFHKEFFDNVDEYDAIYYRLADDFSKQIFLKIVKFRLTGDIDHLRGFTDQQDRQYFEEFLKLSSAGETFVDVGSFDGYTTEQFIDHCPEYREVLVFEPLDENMSLVKKRLADKPRVSYFPVGLSDRRESLRFTANGSASRSAHDGQLVVDVDRLDDIVARPITFLKMDIEGGEAAALEGACETIRRYHPRLAVSVYHKVDDIRNIPRVVLSQRDDYRIFLRHYTEGVDETVMFFIPAS